MENWKRAWRIGFAPAFATEGLIALRDALRTDDKRLILGMTTEPPPLLCVQDWHVEAADAVGFCGWRGREGATVGEVEIEFARVCFAADTALGEPAAGRHFLTFWDSTPREIARRELLPEVERSLILRFLEKKDAEVENSLAILGKRTTEDEAVEFWFRHRDLAPKGMFS